MWKNVMGDIYVTLTKGHGCGIDKEKIAYLLDKERTIQPITTKLLAISLWSCLLPD